MHLFDEKYYSTRYVPDFFLSVTEYNHKCIHDCIKASNLM